jgi:hypothetical protein
MESVWALGEAIGYFTGKMTRTLEVDSAEKE